MQYYQRSDEAVAAEAAKLEREAAEFGLKVPVLYPLSGSTVVRILPPYSDAGVFFAHVHKHRVSNGRSADVFACPRVMADSYCAVCEVKDEFMASKETAKMDYARENLRSREYTLYNALAISGPANKKGEVPTYGTVYVLEVGVTVHRQVINLDQDPAGGWADITNPEKGVNIVIKRTGVKFDTKYDVTPHGGGRSNLWTDLTSRGIDPNTLVLHDLSKVYAVPDAQFVSDIAARIPRNVGGPVSAPGPSTFTPPPQQTFQPAPTVAPTLAPQPVTQNGTPGPRPAAPFVPPPPRS